MTDDDSRIVEVEAWECLDSRGLPTVACGVRLADGAGGVGIAPAGASTGTHEARERRDGGGRLDGKGTRTAVRAVAEVIAPRLEGLPAARRAEVDRLLRELDGPRSAGHVGANATIATSIAVWLAAAASARVAPFELVSADLATSPTIPMPMVNILSGGLHAARAMDVQDVLVVPLAAGSFAAAIEWCGEVRRHAAHLLGERGGSPALVADEGGLVLAGATTPVALEFVVDAVTGAGFRPGSDVALAIDVAANTFWSPQDGRYELGVDGRALSTSDWVDEVTAWCSDFPVVSIEDPVADTDEDGWAQVGPRLGGRLQVLGDDRFVTDADRVRRGAEAGTANAVLVKPNQVGTMTEAEDVLRTASAHGMAAVVSARSGDTEQSWLADLAIGGGSGQIKVGSTTRSERTAKWNRVLQVEATRRLPFAGAGSIAPLPGWAS